MGVFGKLFSKTNSEPIQDLKNPVASKRLQDMIDNYGEDAMLPSFPLASKENEPLIMYQVADYMIALNINVPAHLGLPETGNRRPPVFSSSGL